MAKERNKRKFSKDDKPKSKFKNDISWYSNHPQLLKDAASLSFNSIYGLPTPILEDGISPDLGDPITGTSIPGIMLINYDQTVGVSENSASEVNNTSRLIYSFIRHANSGSRNYEAPDYMMYLIAMGGIYIYYAELVRLYGILRSYSVLNRYVGKACVEVMGYDYDNLMSNLASLRYYINSFAVRANSFAVPKEFAYYDRITATPLHIFKDAKIDKSGLYIFRPTNILSFNATAEETGSSLFQYTMDMTTLDDIISYGNDLLTNLMTDEDIGIMSGDTLKAFGSDKCRVLAEIPENYVTIPVYDEVYLGQIHNALPLHVQFETRTTGAVVYQENNSIFSKLFHRGTGVIESLNAATNDANTLITRSNFLLDCGIDNPTPDMVMEFTRLRPGFSSEESIVGSYRHYYLSSCGPEVITDIQLYSLNATGGVIRVDGNHPSVPIVVDNDDSTAVNNFNFAKYKQIFDWAPIQYELISTDGGYVQLYPLGELFNFTPVSNIVLDKLNSAALLSLFFVPGMGVTV